MAGRKPKEAAVIVETGLEGAEPALQGLQREAGKHDLIVRQETGSVVPYNRYEVLARIRGLMDAGARLMLELGEALVLLRENEPNADYQALVAQLGFDERMASRFMQAARKFRLGVSPEDRPRFEGMSRGKMYELLVLDDEEVAELASGGSVAGLTLDDIDTMSTSELRRTLREERAKAKADADSKDRLIDAKNQIIDQSQEELDKLTHGGKDVEKRLAVEREQNAVKTFNDAALELLGSIQRFDLAVADCLTEQTEARMTLATQTVTWLFQRIAQVALDRDMPVDFQAVVDPLALNG